MQKIYLDNFTLEEYNYNDEKHRKTINDFDNDKEIRDYIIGTYNSFNEIIEYYSLYDQFLYNKLYIVKNKDNDIIGEIELDGEKDNLYLNYAILKKYRNKGYCTKLLKEITKYLLNELKTISLLIKKENIKSRKLAKRAGYTKIFKDDYGFIKYQINS